MIKNIKNKIESVMITVGNVNTSIIASNKILDDLHEAFAYEVEDAAYIRDAKIKFYMNQNRVEKAKEWAEWSGKFSVFKRTKFGTGILSDVLMYLKDNDIDVKIIDMMEKQTPRVNNFSAMSTSDAKDLYDYQEEAYTILKANDFRGVVSASVAFGKTVLASAIMERVGVPTIILVDRKEIMEQWKDEINNWFGFVGEKIKGVSGRVWYHNFEPVIMLCTSRLVGSIFSKKNDPKSMVQRNEMIRNMCKSAGLLIYDEVHHASAKSARKAVERITAYHRIGLSGTVNMREDNSDYEYLASIGNVMYSFTSTELVEKQRGASIDIIMKSPAYDPDWMKLIQQTRSYPDLYEMYIVNNEVRNGVIFNAVLKHATKGDSILVLVDRVPHARRLATALGDIATYTSSDDESKKRKEKIRKFKAGEISTLVCTYSLIGEGFDFTELNVLIIAGGKSEIKVRQSLGRIMRKKKDGSRGILYDFADPINPFRDHFIDRMRVYNSEDVYNIIEKPRWVDKYV